MYGSFSKSAKEALRKFFSKKGYSLKDVFDFNGQLWKKISELDMEGKDLGCFFENGDSLHWKCHWVFLRRMYEFSRYCIQRYGKKWIPEGYFRADLVSDNDKNALEEIFSPFAETENVLEEFQTNSPDYPSVRAYRIVSDFFRRQVEITSGALEYHLKGKLQHSSDEYISQENEHPAAVTITVKPEFDWGCKTYNFHERVSESYSELVDNVYTKQYAKRAALLKGFFYYQTLMWNVYRSGSYEIMKVHNIVIPNLTDDFDTEYSQLLFGRSHSVEEFKFSDEAVCTEVLNDGFLANSETKDALQQNMIDIKPRLKHSDSFTFGLKKRSLKQSEDYGKMYERFTERVEKFLVKDCWMLGNLDEQPNPSDM